MSVFFFRKPMTKNRNLWVMDVRCHLAFGNNIYQIYASPKKCSPKESFYVFFSYILKFFKDNILPRVMKKLRVKGTRRADYRSDHTFWPLGPQTSFSRTALVSTALIAAGASSERRRVRGGGGVAALPSPEQCRGATSCSRYVTRRAAAAVCDVARQLLLRHLGRRPSHATTCHVRHGTSRFTLCAAPIIGTQGWGRCSIRLSPT